MIEKEPVIIPADMVDAVKQSPRLFPEVVRTLGGSSLESMRQVRDSLRDLINQPTQTPGDEEHGL